MRSSIVIILAIFAGCADNVPKRPTAWVKFQHPVAPFTMLLPSYPSELVGSNQGKKRVAYRSSLGKSASIICWTIPSEQTFDITQTELLLVVLQELLKHNHPTSKVHEQRTYLLQGKYPGIDATLETAGPNNGSLFQRVRMVILPQETIMILAEGSATDVHSEDMDKALESLAILEDQKTPQDKN